MNEVLTQQFDFSYDTLGVDQVFESFGNLLDSDLGFDAVVEGRANHTVCSMTNLLNVFKLILNDKIGTYRY